MMNKLKFKLLKFPAISVLIIAVFFLSQKNNLASAKPCFQGASAGYVRPQLSIGITGHSQIKKSLNIRSQSGLESKIIGKLPPGGNFKVLAGPECRDSYVWWKINYNQYQGWIVESNPENFTYWVVPNQR